MKKLDGHMEEKTEQETEEVNEVKIETATADTADHDTADTEFPESDRETKCRNTGFRNGLITGVIASLCGVSLFCGGWMITQKKQVDAETKTGAAVLTDTDTQKKMTEIQKLIDQYYLNDLDSELLRDYLYKGIAAGLDDPYADYYSREELTSVLDSSRGEYYGIGAVISENRHTGELCIVQVYEGSPAEKGGLRSGDLILALEGESAEGLGLSELVKRIKSAEGEFHITVHRPETEEELELTLTCDEVIVSHVEYEMLEDQIGYIRITEFTGSAVTQFSEAAEALNQKGMQKLIVDLRSNPGGLLDAVCDILDEVLPQGMIVYMENRDGERTEFLADDKRSVTCEIAVLVDGYSASASEIFAGAIQDYGLGPVIGTQTYGKGVVQKTYSLSDGSAFKMTVEKYYTAKGQDIEGNGITPDLVVEEVQNESEDGSLADGNNKEQAEQKEDLVLQRALEELKK